MKRLICVLILTLSNISLSQNYPHIFELRGLEDSLGNTHLFYRYVYPYAHCWSKDIYHFDLTNSYDTLFIHDSGGEVYPGYGCEGDYIYDYEFFDNDPAKYIYGGFNLWIDPTAIIKRYDSEIQQLTIGALTEIEISDQSDSLVYAALGGGLFKSTDGGYNFEFNDSMQTVDVSIISLSKNNDSQIYGTNDYKLVRSINEGNSYTIVNNYAAWNEDAKLFYDTDGQNIYGVTNFQGYSFLHISNGNGDPHTWNPRLEIEGNMLFTLDENQSGEIYYATGIEIFKSTDYGATFFLYKTLDRMVTGLYKKSGSEILYASTPLEIYEIIFDTLHVIKSLPIPQQVFDWYPLFVGNKWIYEKYREEFDGIKEFIGLATMEVIGDTILDNQKKYYQLKNEPLYWIINTGLIRLDSLNGKTYIYLPNENNEVIYDDLMAEVGDTIWVDSAEYKVLFTEEPIDVWGMQTYKKYIDNPFWFQGYELVKNIGMYSWGFRDFFATYSLELKGCVINGIVYGDTTVVSVEDEIPNLPTEFSLSQNYPNPFNPTTKIKYSIPTSPLNPSPYQGEGNRERFITLKVYDVLGNEIATLVNEEKPAGEYEVEFNPASSVRYPASGVYFYQLKAGGFIETKKMILIK